jgi:hypothetical protein
MPVVLTGDVHHHIPSADRRHARESESELAVEYARIAEGYGLNVTLFVTGLAVRKDSDAARPLASMDQVEIGGHGWDAFQPRWLYRPLARASGSPHGYRRWQQRKIVRTCEVLERFCGVPVRSWRDHAYVHDRNTAALLAEAGIVAWSDEVDRDRAHPYVHSSGVVVLPLNTLPDHENLYHGDRTLESVKDGSSVTAAEWLERVLGEVEHVESQGGIATILAHPLCMKVVDDWKTFRLLCEGLAGYPSLFATDAARAVTDAS